MSTSIRSSVRPKSSKQPWGTIIKPKFGMGYQRMTKYEITQIVNRLYYIPLRKPQPVVAVNCRRKEAFNKIEIDSLINRLTENSRGKSADARRLCKPFYDKMGIVSSFAWRGYKIKC